MLRDLFEGGQGALVALDGDDFARPFGEQRPREPAGPRTDLDDRRALERARGARDARREVEVEQEILAELLFGAQPVPGNDLAQRGKIVDLHRHRIAPSRRPVDGARLDLAIVGSIT